MHTMEPLMRSCLSSCSWTARRSFRYPKRPQYYSFVQPPHVSSFSTTANSEDHKEHLYPRAAVSICLRCRLTRNDDIFKDYYLLVQRARKPGRGLWSFPGGKLEWGESIMEGGLRELREETKFMSADEKRIDADRWDEILWHDGAVYISDVVGEGYHFVIAQCFGNLEIQVNEASSQKALQDALPKLKAEDDALDAAWWTHEEMMMRASEVVPELSPVIDRVEELSRHGLLPTGSYRGVT